jgi:hypothetical protein
VARRRVVTSRREVGRCRRLHRSATGWNPPFCLIFGRVRRRFRAAGRAAGSAVRRSGGISFQASPHYSRKRLANDAGLTETLVVGGPGRIRHCCCISTLGCRRPPPRGIPSQAGLAIDQVSPDYSRAFRE